ncbi:MAG: hypothetical protein AAGF24_04995 [Cyanobacteria bacterium P01_H01_bin.121]
MWNWLNPWQLSRDELSDRRQIPSFWCWLDQIRIANPHHGQ